MSILACCISAFVIVNRFGFALNGAMCAFDRIYYDTLNGQLKKEGEKWEGLKNTAEILDYIEDLCIFIEDKNIEIEDSFLKKWCKDNKFQKDNRKLKKGIPGFDEDSQKKIKERIKFEYFHDQYKLLYAFLKVISMICYCLLLIAATASGVSMMFYACLKRQGYLITFMHVFWNIIRFFIVSFFLYGTAYGIFFLILKDLISCANKIFSEYLLKDIDINNEAYIDEENKKYVFLHNCLFPDKPIRNVKTSFLDTRLKVSIIDFFTSNEKEKCTDVNIKEYLQPKVEKEILGSFDCSFLKGDLNHLYKALYDASSESQYLTALCLCSSFFGAISVYFYLLVIHHYNNEIFFDSGKSIFTGFDGFGRGYKKKNREKDPAYKKRKLRAEIELTSKNDEQDEYNNFNKNEDD